MISLCYFCIFFPGIIVLFLINLCKISLGKSRTIKIVFISSFIFWVICLSFIWNILWLH